MKLAKSQRRPQEYACCIRQSLSTTNGIQGGDTIIHLVRTHKFQYFRPTHQRYTLRAPQARAKILGYFYRKAAYDVIFFK